MADERNERSDLCSGNVTLASVPNDTPPRTEKKKSLRHELRTPLNQIIGYSELLQEDAEEHGLGAFVEDLKKIERAGRHLLELINSIADSDTTPTPVVPSHRESQPDFALPILLDPSELDQLKGPDRILVVDDNEANRDLLARRLRNKGMSLKRSKAESEPSRWSSRNTSTCCCSM
ncbi:MAG TPA: histidine kinase dimerization/phospho-acceptor domain-containing protein [Polyangiaceae bacterium]|nr:histidine kinase dimerization/phospho-acceptor domain-containing protein [Polyangiaceae bacterium]HPK92803.1 histidine kinase dimerization/phospho-acceptor domain-containing protein [Polyangiaceae bacterium]